MSVAAAALIGQAGSVFATEAPIHGERYAWSCHGRWAGSSAYGSLSIGSSAAADRVGRRRMLAIEKAEERRGRREGRPRVKFDSVEDMLKISPATSLH